MIPEVMGSSPIRHLILRGDWSWLPGGAHNPETQVRVLLPLQNGPLVYRVGRRVFIPESVGSTPRRTTMGKRKDLRDAAKALQLDTKKDQWSNNWEFEWSLISDISFITHEGKYPVGMEEIESVLIALTKIEK